MVRKGRLELPRVAPLEPKSSASTNSATFAHETASRLLYTRLVAKILRCMLLQSLPRMSRPHAALELSVWALMAVPLGVLSGGVAGVLASTIFSGAAPVWVIAIAIALLTGAGPLANVGSLLWAHWSLGRDKVRAVNRLQWLFATALGIAAFAPVNAGGLALFVVAILTAQVLWCGIITIRASIWRLNYDRSARFAFAADNQAVVSLIHAITGGMTGWLVQTNPGLFRPLLLVTALSAIASLFRLRRVRVRRQRQLLNAELAHGGAGAFRLDRYLGILRDDRLYRHYMTCMMILGTGNLMFTAPCILIMSRQLGMDSLSQVLITSSLPTLIVPVSARLWSRVLTREHVIGFRRHNSRWYAIAIAIAATGAATGASGSVLRRAFTGRVQQYAAFSFVGVIVIAVLFIIL